MISESDKGGLNLDQTLEISKLGDRPSIGKTVEFSPWIIKRTDRSISMVMPFISFLVCPDRERVEAKTVLGIEIPGG